MKKIFLLLALWPSLSFGQGISPTEKEHDYGPFRECGLVTRWASNSISDSCLTVANNVYFDEDLSAYRRRGYGEYNITPCQDSKQIRGLWSYDANDGQRYIVIFSSNSLFWTKNQGDCNKIDTLPEINSSAELECVPTLGRLWCTNGIDTPFWTTVTSTGTFGFDDYLNDYLRGTKIGSFRNRVIMSGIPGQLTRIRMSGEGDGEDWTIKIPGVSTTPASISISGLNDGKVVTALMGQYQNAYYIGREDDLWSLSGNDRRDFTLRQVSSQIGVKDGRSVKEKDNCLYWLSKRGVEGLCGTTIERASDAIRPIIDTVIRSYGNTRTKTYDTQAEWETGLYNTSLPQEGKTSTTIYPGSVVPSTWSHTNDEASEWSAGSLVDISTYQYVGGISLSRNKFDIYENFSDGEISSNPSWVSYNVLGGNYAPSDPYWNHYTTGFNQYASIYNKSFRGLVQNVNWTYGDAYAINQIRSSEPIPFDGSTFGFGADISAYSTAGDPNYDTAGTIVTIGISTMLPSAVGSPLDSANYNGTRINLEISNSFDNGYCNYGRARLVYINKNNGTSYTSPYSSLSGGCNVSCTSTRLYVTGDTIIAESTAPTCSFYISTTTPVNSLDSIRGMDFYQFIYMQNRGDTTNPSKSQSQTSQSYVGNIKAYFYASSGTWTSPVYDTGISTPVGGPYYFSQSLPLGTSVYHYISQSKDGVNFGSDILVSTLTYYGVEPSTTSGEFRVPFTEQYWKEKIVLTSPYSTSTPVVIMNSVEATTTGYYIGDCVNTAGVTKWGNFRPSSALTGGSDIKYWVNSGDSCNQVTRSTAPWVGQSANAPIATSTGNFLGYKVFESAVTTTDTIRLDGLTIEWNEGSARPPVASVVYRDRYYMFYTTNTQSTAYNDHAVVLDMNNKWSLLDDIYAYSATMYENQLYTGDSRPTGKLHLQDIGVDDAGNAYNFQLRTSDYDFGNPIEKKKLKRVYFIFKSEETPGQNINLNVHYYINGSTTAYSLNSAGLDEAVENGYFVAKFPAINGQASTFNWLSLEIDYNGKQGPLNLYAIKVVYEPIRIE